MNPNEDELLVGALGELGGRAGGRRGSEIAARRPRKNVLELDLALGVDPAVAVDRVRDVLQQQGRVLSVTAGRGTAATQLIGIVGAGFGNLNPAVVTVLIYAADQGSRLVVRGAAKEGLIKQRAGETAAKRVATAISASEP